MSNVGPTFFVKIQHFPKVPFVSKDPQSSANCSKTSYRENTTIMLFSLVFVKVPKKQFSLIFPLLGISDSTKITCFAGSPD